MPCVGWVRRVTWINPNYRGYSMFERDPQGGYWFSRNPSKAWAEKFFLCYLPFFFALNGGKQAFGWMDAGNLWHVGQNVLMLAPLYVIPLLIRDERSLGRRWYQTYWFKFNLWIYLFAFIATYFFTEYFFVYLQGFGVKLNGFLVFALVLVHQSQV